MNFKLTSAYSNSCKSQLINLQNPPPLPTTTLVILSTSIICHEITLNNIKVYMPLLR